MSLERLRRALSSGALAVKAQAIFATLLLCLTFSSYASSHLSKDPRVNDARKLVDERRYDEALERLRPIAVGHPDKTDVLFLIGISAIEAASLPGKTSTEKEKLLNEAILALHVILVDRPGLTRVRLELARAFFLKGEDALSKEQFEIVLSTNPPSAMKANINSFLNKIRGQRNWNLWFGIIVVSDSNLNSASESDVINLFGLPFRLGDDQGVKAGKGVRANLGAEYTHVLSDRLSWLWSANISRTEHKQSAFDQTYVSLRSGPKILVDRDTEISLLGTVAGQEISGKRYSEDFGLRAGLDKRLTERWSLNGSVYRTKRNYVRSSHQGSDGFLTGLTLGAEVFISPTARADFSVGYNRTSAITARENNHARWARIGGTKALPRGFTLGASIEQRWTRWGGTWFPFTPANTQRRDKGRSFRLSVLNRGYTLLGFSPRLSWVKEMSKTNAQLRDYSRVRYEVEMVRQF